MEKNSDFGYYGYPPFTQYDFFSQGPADDTFNPAYQYEQSYMYYRYLTQMMEYKIKCKEYEKMYGKDAHTERRTN